MADWAGEPELPIPGKTKWVHPICQCCTGKFLTEIAVLSREKFEDPKCQ